MAPPPPSRWCYGPLPDEGLLADSGLLLTRPGGLRPQALHARLTEAIATWRQQQRRWEGSPRPELEEAYRAGLRALVDQTFAARCPVESLEDLRHWCLVQLEALALASEAYPVCLCQVSPGDTLYDREL